MTPKARLIEDKDTAKFIRQVVDDRRFQYAAEVALLEMIRNQPDTTNQVDAVAYYNRVVGARIVLATLATIADQPKPLESPASNKNLDHHS